MIFSHNKTMSFPPFQLPKGTLSRTIQEIIDYFDSYLLLLKSGDYLDEWLIFLKNPLNAHSKKTYNLYLAIKTELETFPNAISDWDVLRARHGFTKMLKSFSTGNYHRDKSNVLVLDIPSILFKDPISNAFKQDNDEIWKMLIKAIKSRGIYALFGAGVSSSLPVSTLLLILDV
jgi:hypothetical protein